MIKKSASAKLGVSIKGGTKSTMGNPLDSNDKGIFVSKVYTMYVYSTECISVVASKSHIYVLAYCMVVPVSCSLVREQ